MINFNKRGATDSTFHPRDEQLIQYFSGTLSASAHENIQVHLVDCSECLESFKDVRDFLELHRPGEQMINEDIEQQWKKIAPRLREPSPPVAPLPYKRSRAASVGAMAALAAMVLLVAMLGLMTISQRRQKHQLAQQLQGAEQTKLELQAEQQRLAARVNQLEQEAASAREKAPPSPPPRVTVPTVASAPQLNVPIYDLYARDFNRRSTNESEVNKINPPATANSIVLILNGSGVPDAAGYRIELSAENGESLWRGKGLTKGHLGNLTITVDRGLLPEGLYRLRLYRQDAQSGSPVAEYVLRVQ